MREFLTSRRARITPERAGLPHYGGRRRVAGLRRDEVALLLANGLTVRTAAQKGGVGERTVHRWLAEDANFRQRVIDLRAQGADETVFIDENSEEMEALANELNRLNEFLAPEMIELVRKLMGGPQGNPPF